MSRFRTLRPQLLNVLTQGALGNNLIQVGDAVFALH